MVQMLGWLIADAAFASHRNRSHGLTVSGDIFGRNLEGHKAIQTDVLRLVNEAHAGATQLFEDAVVRAGKGAS